MLFYYFLQLFFCYFYYGEANMPGQSIIRKIKKECDSRKISIYKLSKLTNIQQSTLNSLLHNQNPNPKYETIVNIAKGLDMTIKEFFDDELFI